MPWPTRCWNCTVRAPLSPLTNDDWRDDPIQEALIEATGIPPTNDLESAIEARLVPGAYTAIVSGNGNTSGVGLVEVYDLNEAAGSRLANLSTRAFVNTGDSIVIAGFLLSNNGPSRSGRSARHRPQFGGPRVSRTRWQIQRWNCAMATERSWSRTTIGRMIRQLPEN